MFRRNLMGFASVVVCLGASSSSKAEVQPVPPYPTAIRCADVHQATGSTIVQPRRISSFAAATALLWGRFDPESFLSRLIEKHGPVIEVQSPTAKRVLIVHDWGAFMQALRKTGSKFDKNNRQENRVSLLGPIAGTNNLLSAPAKDWKHLRNQLKGIFDPASLEKIEFPGTVARIGREAVLSLRKEITANQQGKATLPVVQLADRLVMESLTKGLIGVDLSDQERENLINGLHQAFFYMNLQSALSLPFSITRFPIFPFLWRMRMGLTHLRQIADQILREGEERLREGQSVSPILQKILSLKHVDDSPFSIQEKREQINSILFAGFHTTTATLSSILLQAGKLPPETLQAIVDESRRADESGWSIEAQTDDRMPVLSALISEGLRWQSPAFMLLRQATEKSVLKLGDGRELQLLPNDLVLFPSALMASDEALFGEGRYGLPASKFAADRFSVENLRKQGLDSKDDANSCSFAAGPRICIAQTMALTELKILLGTLLTNFKFISENNEGRVTNKELVKSADRLSVTIEAR